MQRIAAFDFDGTLTRKDTFIALIRYRYGYMGLLRGLLRFFPLLLAYKCNCYPNWKIKQHIFAYFFGGMPQKQFDEICRRFFEENKALLYEDACTKIAEHRSIGDELVIVSAGIENTVRPFAAYLGIHRLLCTKPQIDADGRLSGVFLTPNCYGLEKLTRFQTLFPERQSYYLIAYGDSKGDRELLAYADEAHYRLFRK